MARGLAPAMLAALGRIARRRRLVLLVAGDARAALGLHAGLHLPDREPGLSLLPFLLARRRGAPFARLSVAAHGRLPALRRARRIGPDLSFLSPVFATLSHPGAPALGPFRWALTARAHPGRVAALGGLQRANCGRIPRFSAGLAAIGGLS